MFSTRSFDRPFVRHQTRERDILKANKPTLLKIGTRSLHSKDVKRQLWGNEVKGQGHTFEFRS